MKRRKIMALLLAAVLGLTSVMAAGCGGSEDDSTEVTADTVYTDTTIYGEVTAVGDSSITIDVGTYESDESTEDDQASDDGDSTEVSDGADESGSSTEEGEESDAIDDGTEDGGMETPDAGVMAGGQSMELTLTGESVTVEISEDTAITKMSMGGMGSSGGMGGDAPSDMGGDTPSGDGGELAIPENGSEMPDAEIPEKPDGETSGDSTDASEAKADTDESILDTFSDSLTVTVSTDSTDVAAISSDSTVVTISSDSTESSDASSQDGGDVPEKPDGEEGDAPDDMGEATDGMEMGDAPDMSGEFVEGSTGMGDMGEMDMFAGGETISLSDISVGDIVSVTYDSDGLVTAIVVISSDSDSSLGSMDGGSDSANAGGMPVGSDGLSGGTSSGVEEYTAVAEYTEDTEVEGESFSSTGSDENAILVNGANVIFDSITVDRTSSNSTGGDNSSFYGVGAALLALSGTMTIRDASITTDSAGGAGVFSYGDAVVYVSDSTITTQQDTSGGIHVAGGGTLYAWDLTVETNGESSAAIRSDRGGGTMVVDGGTYTSNGTGSPAVYCTADIAINDATLTATSSEAICIEGLNSLHIFDSDLTGSIKDSSQNDCSWNVILYQSMSGDSEVGNSTFEMQGGSITAENGGMFYTTNTESTFIIKDVDLYYADDSEFFLKVTGNSNERGWGSTGSNGADCVFTAIEQEMEGAIIWDSISTLEFYMTDGSTLTGYAEDDESNAGSGGDGYCNIYIDSSSTWIVTGDSVLTGLYCEGTIEDEDGKTVTIVGSDGTVYVQGTSSYTITVDTYETSADMSGASEAGSWSDYEVEEP